MKKIILLLLTTFLFAVSFQKLSFENYISKLTFNKNYIAVALENGEIIIKSFNSFKDIAKIKLPNIEDFMGDKIPMPVFNLDIKNNKILILAGGEDNSKNLFIFDIKTKKLSKILTTKESLMKAFFYKDKILFAYLSDELALYDIKNRKIIYKKQIGNYVFSDCSIFKDIAVLSDESGVIKVVDIQTGKKLSELKGFNKDQTLSIDIFQNFVINGTADKRIAVYNLKNGNTIFEFRGKFLPYGVAITDNRLAIQYNEKNDIALFNFNKKMKLLKGHTMALNGMKFINKNRLISYSPAEIIIWNLEKN